MHFELVRKKYALTNSYFKNMPYGAPSTILEITQYHKQHNDLPFAYAGDNWVYDAFCERQKRHNIYLSQFLTPDKTAVRIAELAREYFPDGTIPLDACCGTGQLTNQLVHLRFEVEAFELDLELFETCKILFADAPVKLFHGDYRDDVLFTNRTGIVSNPPYEDIPGFLGWLHGALATHGTAVLLIPFGSVDKTRPKALVELLQKFIILHRERMQEEFARTKVSGEIVVLQKR